MMERLAALLLLSLALACRAAEETASQWVALRGSRSGAADAASAAALQGAAVEAAAPEASGKEAKDDEDDDDDAEEERGDDICEASRELCGDYCTYNMDGEGRRRCEESPECRVLDVKDFGGKAGDDGWLCESADTKCREFEVLSPEHFTCQSPGADAPQWEDDSAYFDESEEDTETTEGAAAENATALQAALAEPVASLEPQVAVGSHRCHRGRQTQRLFHLTDRSACEAILKGGFKIGRPGIAGRGVYFATSPSDTFGKAECPACKGETHERPCMIEALVRVGKSKRIPFRGDKGLNGPKLWGQCYDSAWIPRGNPHGSKPEYVVYNPRQVHSLCVFPVNRYGQAVGERRCTTRH